ncbi:interferon alpha-14-like [Choloepus didactylus]|uniref:interferon alpha-14-like n=1 Tax=Choloepus didactylus TaxID=27675 RepID=UPI00189DBA69|nr:interferon alpha-14-like [Choloepus didactylus]
MTSLSLMDCSFLLLLSTTACSLDCHFQRSSSNREILQHLENLGGKFPLGCLKDRNNFKFLQVSKADEFRKESALVVIQEMQQQIFNAFNLNVSQSSWDESSLERFLSALYQQMEKTEMCLEQEIRKEGHSSLQRKNTRLEIKKYFQGIHDYLEDQKYSHCAWEVVRVEIRRCFLFIEQLTRRLKDQEIGQLHN